MSNPRKVFFQLALVFIPLLTGLSLMLGLRPDLIGWVLFVPVASAFLLVLGPGAHNENCRMCSWVPHF